MITATPVRGRRSSDRLHVISCYAPTFAASRAEKDNFFDDLQQALNKMPSCEPFVILGDFNARVGSREDGDGDEEDQWERVLGPHGWEKSTRLAENYCPSLPRTKQLCVTPGSRRKTFTNKPGNIQNPNNGTALTLPSSDKRIVGGALMQL